MNPTETTATTATTIEPTIDEVVGAMSPEERAEFNEWCDSRAQLGRVEGVGATSQLDEVVVGADHHGTREGLRVVRLAAAGDAYEDGDGVHELSTKAGVLL